MTIQRIVTVAMLGEGRGAFEEMASWYHVPPHLMPLLRTAKDTRREVRITHNRTSILAVELLPAPPPYVRFSRMIARLRANTSIRARRYGRFLIAGK